MFSKWRKYSYADQKSYLSHLRLNVLKISFFVFAYIMITTIFFPTMVMQSASMQPEIQPGDRFVFLSLNLSHFIRKFSVSEELPYNRGDIVSLDFESSEKSLAFRIIEKILRFATAGKIGMPGSNGRVFIKRIIALPGDEISMKNFIMQVKPAGKNLPLTEFELAGKRLYKPDIPQVPAIWNETLPFSGSMQKLVLGEGECFVLSDDRSNTNDSRTWGPVPLKIISGKALFRYWPLNHIGWS
ncbi:MAG: signal peptidase I [Termitinemataceae bacterium]|jgi:signal peptidase I|nr:MAG: signal peptidase I [Termitinemataceae bacterium]